MSLDAAALDAYRREGIPSTSAALAGAGTVAAAPGDGGAVRLVGEDRRTGIPSSATGVDWTSDAVTVEVGTGSAPRPGGVGRDGAVGTVGSGGTPVATSDEGGGTAGGTKRASGVEFAATRGVT